MPRPEVFPVWNRKARRWIDKLTGRFISHREAVTNLRWKRGGVYDWSGRFVPRIALRPPGRVLYTPPKADFYITYTRYDKDIYARPTGPDEFVVGIRYYRLADGRVISVKARFLRGEDITYAKAEMKFRDALRATVTGKTDVEVPEVLAPRKITTFWVVGKVSPL